MSFRMSCQFLQKPHWDFDFDCLLTTAWLVKVFHLHCTFSDITLGGGGGVHITDGWRGPPK